ESTVANFESVVEVPASPVVAVAAEAVVTESAASEVPAGEKSAVEAQPEAEATKPHSPFGTFTLPSLPDPTVLLSPPMRKMDVQVIVSGKVLKREIEVPDKATVADAIKACNLTVNGLD